MRSRLRLRKALVAGKCFSSRRPDPEFTFESFVYGDNNRFALSVAREFAASAGTHSRPLFICGGVGTGKTHLLHAIGNSKIGANPAIRLGCFSSERFMNSMISALRSNRMPEFRSTLRTVDLLLIDDVHFMAGKEATQEEFFHTIDTLVAAGKQVVVTSRLMPRRTAMDEALLSRLCAGRVAEILPPDRETKLHILMAKAAENAMELPEEVALHLAETDVDDIRRLEGALLTLKAFAIAMQRELTVDLVRDLLPWL